MNKRRKPSHGAAAPAGAPQAACAQPDAARAALAQAAYAPALNAGLQATASRVQEMHESIAGKTFDNLLRVPGLSAPTRLVQAVHDAITQGVYAAVRHGGGAALTLAAGAERRASDPTRTPGGKEQLLRSALNGAVGDALAAAGNPLAVQMSLHRSSRAKDQALPLRPDALASLRSRVCVFIHGLACDEGSWSLRTAAWAGSPWEGMLPVDEPSSYGDLLEREPFTAPISAPISAPIPAPIPAPVSAIYLRYNTGLPIEANAQQFAALLEDLLRAAPQVHDLVLVGHSMGGLVARRALAIGASDALPWVARVTMVICLGSPHQGAGLAKLGEIASALLMATEVTRPLGRIANARSQGVKDLRHGLSGAAAGGPPTAESTVPLRLVYATLGDAKDADGAPGGALLGKLFGDGLVHAASAADDGLTGDVQRVEVTGLGHMGLLGDPRVYAQIRRWLGAPELT